MLLMFCVRTIQRADNQNLDNEANHFYILSTWHMSLDQLNGIIRVPTPFQEPPFTEIMFTESKRPFRSISMYSDVRGVPWLTFVREDNDVVFWNFNLKERVTFSCGTKLRGVLVCLHLLPGFLSADHFRLGLHSRSSTSTTCSSGNGCRVQDH